MRIYRKYDAKNFKTAYVLTDHTEKVFAEGTCLEVLFELLRLRDQMELLERVQANLLIYECYGFYADFESDGAANRRRAIEDEEVREAAIAAAVVTTAKFRVRSGGSRNGGSRNGGSRNGGSPDLRATGS